jgi:hypothetical protein
VKNHQLVPHAHWEDTGMKDQGWALLDESSTASAPGEDDPTSTDATALTAGKDDRTYKTLSK